MQSHKNDTTYKMGIDIGSTTVKVVLADEEKDFGTANMLKWFVDEQIEEEANAQELIDSLKMIKDNGFGLYMLDKELKARVYTTPAPLATSAE